MRLILRRLMIITVFVAIVTSVFSMYTVNAQDDTTDLASQGCAITPNLAGQGFSFQGLGFSFQGLGFSFQGLGFSFQGLGFSFQGLGLDDPRLEDPALFAEEILANPVPTDWLGAQLEEIVNGAEFGSSRSAILIIDDSDHGSNVQSVIEYMASVPGVQALLDSGQLYVELLDISRVNYTGDEIAAAIGERVEALQNDYENIVLNFSITFIPCEADFDEDGEPDFVFSEFIDVVAEEAEEEGGEEEELLPIVPTIDCAVLQEIGESAYQLNVVFGYDNPNSETVYLEERFEGLEQNFVSTNVSSEGEPFIFFTAETVPEYFVPGTYEEVFEGIIGAFASEGDSFTVEWTLLDTTVGITIEVGEGYEGPTCTVGPGGELDLSPEDEVVPFLQCVEVFEGDDTFVTATFGYENIGDTTVWLPRGDNGIQVNEAFFEGGDPQPHFFVPGRHRNVWQVSFGGEGSVEWTTGQDFSDFETGYSNSASADINSPECTDEFEIGNYLFEIGLTTSEEIRDALETLFNYDDADDDLDALKSLLQGYLAFSAEDNNQSVFAVASAGNYRPWLGDAPLVPARWDETIAVSASLGLLPEKWIFSQQGDFIAPGGGYFIPNGFDPTGQEIPLVGTSYSAPVVSLIGALWGQYPAACAFPENNNTFFPPIEDFDADDVSFDATDELASPYRCSTEGFPDENRAPIAVDDTAEVDAGASVIIDVLGNDSDPDGDTLSVTNVGTLPMHGTATVNADGTITYQNAGTGTSDNFTYVVSDGELTDTATVTITIERDNGGETPEPNDPRVENAVDVCWIEDPNGNTSAWQVTNDNPVPLVQGQQAKVRYDWAVFIGDSTEPTQTATNWDNSGETRINTVLANRIVVRWYVWDNGVVSNIRIVEAEKPVDVCETPDVAVNPQTTPDPVVTEETPDPVVTEETPEPVVTEETPDPVVTEETPDPVVTEETPDPVVTEETPDPVVTEETPEPVVTEETPEPVVTEETPEPVSPATDLAVCWVENQNGVTTVWRVTNDNPVPLVAGTQQKVVFSWIAYDAENNEVASGDLYDQTGSVQINTSLAERIEVTWFIRDNDGVSEALGTVSATSDELGLCAN